MKTVILLCVISLSISGCVTAYQPISALNITGGYYDKKIENSVYAVGFSANGFTSLSRTRDFTLLRCAELTTKNGFKYFQIITEATGLISNYDNGSPVFQPQQFVSSSGEIFIEMTNDISPNDKVVLYDAPTLLLELRNKYSVPN